MAIFVIDWKLAVMSLILLPVVFYPTSVVRKEAAPAEPISQNEMAEMANVCTRRWPAIASSRRSRWKRPRPGSFRQITQRIFRLNLRQKMTHSLSSPLMEMLGVLVIAAFLLYAGRRSSASA